MLENITFFKKLYRIKSQNWWSSRIQLLLKSCDKGGTENNCHWNIGKWESIERARMAGED